MNKLISISDLTDRQLQAITRKVFEGLCAAEDLGDARLVRILRARLSKLQDEEQARIAEDWDSWPW